MALLDIFKKKKKPERRAEKKIQEVSPSVKPRKPKKLASSPKPKKISDIAYRILKKPHVTEKATDLVGKNQYVFEVFPGSNKSQVKKAVEEVYGVNVVSVRMVNIPRKKRRLGRVEGWRKGYKKAMVKIKEGQKIEVLPR
jgi:large subunit ribosomal protein L23